MEASFTSEKNIGTPKYALQCPSTLINLLLSTSRSFQEKHEGLSNLKSLFKLIAYSALAQESPNVYYLYKYKNYLKNDRQHF